MPRQQLPPHIKKIPITDRSTRKPAVRYEVMVDAGTNQETGKRQQVRRRYATEREARQALAEITQQVSTDAFVPRKAIAVAELCDDWLKSLHNARATTISGYEYCLAPLRERHGRLAAQKLTRPQLDTLLTALRDGGSQTALGNIRRAWSARSLNAAIDAWRLVLNYGCERRELARNVAASMKKVPRPHRQTETYTPDEIRLVLAAADKDRNGHLWYLALSGLRRAEIAGLKWSDIDYSAGTITITRNRVQIGAATVAENEPKTRSSRRTLPLDMSAVSALKKASTRYALEKLALGAAHTDSGYVACNEDGKPYKPGSLTNMWHRLTETAGVKPIRLHDARHSCATIMHLGHQPTAVIAEWLGHADASVTERIYLHSQKDALKAAGATLGRVFKPMDDGKGQAGTGVR